VDALRRLASVLPADGAAAVARRLKLSNVQAERLAALVAPSAVPDPSRGEEGARALLYRMGAERFIDLTLLAWAAQRALEAHRTGAADPWIELIDAALAWVPTRLPVSGADVLALGLKPGPQVGALLAAVERRWIEGDFRAGRGELLAWLKDLASGRP